MNIIKTNDGLLTNVEVLAVLEERKSKRDGRNDIGWEYNSFINSEHEVTRYIQSTPVGKFSSEEIRERLSKVKQIGISLTEAELAQLANHCPCQAVEVHMVIEECAERIDEAGVDSITSLFATKA